jgi:hypothetical protein
MTNFAVIKDNIVVNIVWSDTIEDAQIATDLTCVESTEENPARIGWFYDGITFAPEAPPVVESGSPQ